MSKCLACGYDPETDECEIAGCHEPAMWEGWWRIADGFGIPTGLIQKRCVCEEHKVLLIGFQKQTGETHYVTPVGASHG